MLMELLKGLEMLIGVLKGRGTAEHKREVLAKETLTLHKELTGVVARGRRILELAADRYTDNAAESVTLLSEQLGALQIVKDTMTTGALGSILDLHLPDMTKGLGAVIDAKTGRVYIRLNQIVAGGHELSDAEWVQSMSDQMGARELPAGESLAYRPDRPWPYTLTVYALNMPEFSEIPRVEVDELLKGFQLDVIAAELDYAKANQILDQIESKNEELRKFLTEKFKFEDVL
jgi:hypothetical protein